MDFSYSSDFRFLLTFNKDISLFLEANSARNFIIISLLRSNSNSNMLTFSLVLLYVPWGKSSFVFKVLKNVPFIDFKN